jgi:hypothetical protein
MVLQLGKPYRDTATGETCFPLSGSDFQLFSGLGRATESTLLSEPVFLPFLDALLTALGGHFSKTLDGRIFRQRLRHMWKGDGDVTRRYPDDTWIPRELRMAATSYTLSWEFQEATRAVVSGLDVEEVELVRSEGAAVVPAGTVEEVEDIPEEGGGDESVEERAAARRRVRQARLRAAVAQLRAERLAERYYKRYGSFDGAGSDSDLSSEVSDESRG